MRKHYGSVLDVNGEPVNGVSVKVTDFLTGALAALYSDANGVSQIGNPVTTDPFGYYECYVANGRYSFTITDSQANTVVLNDIQIDDTVPLKAAFTWDPTSLANGAGETSQAVNVQGAVFGDFVRPVPPYSTQGLKCWGWVDAANVVRVRLENGTGSTVDLASGTWGVRVRKA